MQIAEPTITVLGGTDAQGRGLARRLAQVGTAWATARHAPETGRAHAPDREQRA
ncbi:hypothetical protein FBY31_4327 [Arthrobacter sp. SLBN-100]|uniref:hypothetical protein n=1 Tax=Arthrobacter sp. SLBN-100 TaxID=2768450 RepID=UPI0011726764|nr:hypothetical protein [Arthrobacter sp. SLBN-100]TQJ61958.1 hypothetical protein FBY31_4327 [Arthrobacter sp. SLBN-100]